jgi:hypothetical protein
LAASALRAEGSLLSPIPEEHPTQDSITSDLPYRSYQSLDAAREEIQCWSGRQFDPEIR